MASIFFMYVFACLSGKISSYEFHAWYAYLRMYLYRE